MQINDNLSTSYSTPSIFKRLSAALIDVIIVIALMVLCYFAVGDPILKNATSYTTDVQEYRVALLETRLYAISDTGYRTLKESEYEDALEFYYYTYLPTIKNETQPGDDYTLAKKESGLFTETDGKYEKKADVSNAKYTEFYTTYYEKGIMHINEDTTINTIARRVAFYTYTEFGISLFVSVFITYFVFPVFVLKNGKTIGKLALNISLVDARDDIRLNKKRIALRQSSFIIIELALSIFTLLIPLFISITMAVYNKKNQALHDFFAVSRVIDDKNKVLYSTKEELESAREKENTPAFKNGVADD